MGVNNHEQEEKDLTKNYIEPDADQTLQKINTSFFIPGSKIHSKIRNICIIIISSASLKLMLLTLEQLYLLFSWSHDQ